MAILSDPMSLPPEFWAYDVQNWIKEAPVFTIGQLFGYSATTALSAFVAAAESRTAVAFGDLATVGPQLAGIPDGKYLVLWGAGASSSGTNTATMEVFANGTGANGDHSLGAETNVSSATSVMVADTFQLSNNGSNTLLARYSSASAVTACQWVNRFLIALRYGNL